MARFDEATSAPSPTTAAETAKMGLNRRLQARSSKRCWREDLADRGQASCGAREAARSKCSPPPPPDGRKGASKPRQDCKNFNAT